MTRSISLFVYGTLKRGHNNHARYFHDVTSITAATLRGRLFALPQGYPMMVIPDEHVLAHGTGHAQADLETQERTPAPAPDEEGGGFVPRYDGWKDVPGELIEFHDHDWRLAILDELEGFRPDGPCLYRRVLAPLVSHPGRLAWVYVAPSDMPGEIWQHMVEIEEWTRDLER